MVEDLDEAAFQAEPAHLKRESVGKKLVEFYGSEDAEGLLTLDGLWQRAASGRVEELEAPGQLLAPVIEPCARRLGMGERLQAEAGRLGRAREARRRSEDAAAFWKGISSDGWEECLRSVIVYNCTDST